MVIQIIIHRNSINGTVIILFSLAAVFLVIFYISCKYEDKLNGYSENTRNHWFKYGGTKIPWPAHRQGWVCLGIFVLSSFLSIWVISYFSVNKIIIIPVLAGLWFIYLIVAISKSNFKERLGNDGKMGL